MTTPESPANLAIACTLTADELPARLSSIASLGADALLESEIEPGHARLVFAAGAGIRERLDAVVAAEAECCAFLGFAIEEAGDELVLHVRSQPDAQLVIEELAEAFDAPAD